MIQNNYDTSLVFKDQLHEHKQVELYDRRLHPSHKRQHDLELFERSNFNGTDDLNRHNIWINLITPIANQAPESTFRSNSQTLSWSLAKLRLMVCNHMDWMQSCIPKCIPKFLPLKWMQSCIPMKWMQSYIPMIIMLSCIPMKWMHECIHMKWMVKWMQSCIPMKWMQSVTCSMQSHTYLSIACSHMQHAITHISINCMQSAITYISIIYQLHAVTCSLQSHIYLSIACSHMHPMSSNIFHAATLHAFLGITRYDMHSCIVHAFVCIAFPAVFHAFPVVFIHERHWMHLKHCTQFM